MGEPCVTLALLLHTCILPQRISTSGADLEGGGGGGGVSGYDFNLKSDVYVLRALNRICQCGQLKLLVWPLRIRWVELINYLSEPCVFSAGEIRRERKLHPLLTNLRTPSYINC